MGVKTTITGHDWAPSEPQAYSVQEASTPIAVTDSSGSVGMFSVTFPMGANFSRWLTTQGAAISLEDSRKGFILGTVDSVSDNSGMVTLTCISRMGLVNLYRVQAKPYIGTLGGAFAYYLSLAGVTSGFTVDETIAGRPIKIVGWKGDLWYQLKALAAAHLTEIALVSGIIVLRPIRQREAIRGRDIQAPGRQYPGTPIAQFVEVYHYDTETLSHDPIYPPQGWNPEVPILTVQAGEVLEQVVQLEASVHSVNQPVYTQTIAPEFARASVYNAVGDDGLPISAAAWADKGGSLRVKINEDTTSLTITITGPTGLPRRGGGELQSYSIAMAASGGSNRYSSLRLVGSGVRFMREVLRFPTGVPAERAQTEVGVTIDNPFLSTLNEVYTAGTRAAREYSGRKLTLSGTVSAINQLGEKGIISLPTYAEVKARFSGMTYAQVKADPSIAGKSYGQIVEDFRAERRNEFENQVWGNVGGARVWDDRTSRFYRIRTATSVRESIQFTAEDDLAYADVKERYAGMTYAQVKALYGGMSYRDVTLVGLVDV